MRFTLIKDLSNEGSMKWVLSTLLVFSSLYISLDIFVKKISFGVSTLRVKQTLFGDEEEFLDPITESTFLEFIHTEIFFIMMILLTISAIYIRMASKSKSSLFVLNFTMISALTSLVTLALSYYISESFIAIYIGTFFLWHIFSVYMSLFSLWNLHAKSL